jgi:hypothetical protein
VRKGPSFPFFLLAVAAKTEISAGGPSPLLQDEGTLCGSNYQFRLILRFLAITGMILETLIYPKSSHETASKNEHSSWT